MTKTGHNQMMLVFLYSLALRFCIKAEKADMITETILIAETFGKGVMKNNVSERIALY